MDNRQIAAIFARMADILDIQGENPHRIMAYRRAAENIAALSRPLEEIWRAGELDSIPGIGKTLAEKIDELMRTGRLEAYEKLRAQVPDGVVEMLQVPDVGPRKAALFWKELGITSIAELEEAARAGKLRSLPGMGVRSEEKVLAGIEALKRRSGRIPLGTAWELARALLEPLRELPGVVQAAPAGSLRRMRETVGDLDLLVAAEDPEPVMARFRSLPQVAEVLLSGTTKTSIRTHDGYQPTCGCSPRPAGGRRCSTSPAARPTTSACGVWRRTGASPSASTPSSGRTVRKSSAPPRKRCTARRLGNWPPSSPPGNLRGRTPGGEK
jgi:DNA polymerase IV (family X)